MGLDISINVNNPEEIFDTTYYDPEERNFYQHGLSRTFCNFISRRDVISGEPELDQIGRLAGIDITPIYDMNNYGDDEQLQFMLSHAETDEERKQIIDDNTANRDKLKGNITPMLLLINNLIENFGVVKNLPELLQQQPGDPDTLNHNAYFANFDKDTGDGYIDNNLGQDFRNFRRFLIYAKNNGTETVYFTYG